MTELEQLYQADRIKTREINVLTVENRTQAARIRELEAANAILAAEVNRLNIAMMCSQSEADGGTEHG
jgi:hypothetical protein